jgi:hypothetical protein
MKRFPTHFSCQSHSLFGLALSLVLLFLASDLQAQQRYRVSQLENKISIFDSDKLVTTYHYRSGTKPILWPLMGPDEMRFSREYPMVSDSKDEEHDHPHHRSLWMTFGEVNEFDTWAEGKDRGTVCQIGVPTVAVDNSRVVLSAKHVWKGGTKGVSTVSDNLSTGCSEAESTLLHCDAEYTFHGTHEERIIDCRYTMTAARDIHFGDTKEGMFAIRVPEPMRADKRGGSILTSEGRKNGDAWGYPARWVDYSGKVVASNPKTYGISILIHPSSYNAQGRWHVRTYGLFAHNPIGVKDFPKMDKPPAGEHAGGHKLKSGEKMNLYYRVILHRDAYSADQGNQRWETFAASK